MKKIKRKKDSLATKMIFSFISICVIFAILVIGISNIKIYRKRAELQYQILEKEKELSSLILSRNQTDQEIMDLDDDFLVEKIAREQLLLKKSGEELFIIKYSDDNGEEEIEEKKAIWWNPFTW
jgi:cell division protein FtsB